jgi:hypothetical protein
MDLSNADHRTRFPVRLRKLIRPAIQPEHGDLLGLTGLPVGQKQRTIPGPRDWASLIFLSSSRPGRNYFVIHLLLGVPLAPDLILRICDSTVPTCGGCRKRAGEARSGGSTGRSDHSQYSANLLKVTKVNHGERRGGKPSVAHFIFLNACPLSEIMMRGRSFNRHWQIV